MILEINYAKNKKKVGGLKELQIAHCYLGVM